MCVFKLYISLQRVPTWSNMALLEASEPGDLPGAYLVLRSRRTMQERNRMVLRPEDELWKGLYVLNAKYDPRYLEHVMSNQELMQLVGAIHELEEPLRNAQLDLHKRVAKLRSTSAFDCSNQDVLCSWFCCPCSFGLSFAMCYEPMKSDPIEMGLAMDQCLSSPEYQEFKKLWQEVHDKVGGLKTKVNATVDDWIEKKNLEYYRKDDGYLVTLEMGYRKKGGGLYSRLEGRDLLIKYSERNIKAPPKWEEEGIASAPRAQVMSEEDILI